MVLFNRLLLPPDLLSLHPVVENHFLTIRVWIRSQNRTEQNWRPWPILETSPQRRQACQYCSFVFYSTLWAFMTFSKCLISVLFLCCLCFDFLLFWIETSYWNLRERSDVGTEELNVVCSRRTGTDNIQLIKKKIFPALMTKESLSLLSSHFYHGLPLEVRSILCCASLWSTCVNSTEITAGPTFWTNITSVLITPEYPSVSIYKTKTRRMHRSNQSRKPADRGQSERGLDFLTPDKIHSL